MNYITKKHVTNENTRGKYLTIVLLMIAISVIGSMFINHQAQAAVKSYGIVIADTNGKYTYYDMNFTKEGKAAIEVTSAGNVMVPLKKLSKLIPGITYQYDSVKKKATITNTTNGKKIVYTKNSKYLYYYSSAKAKAVRKTMSYKMYVSADSKSVMVHMNTLKWVLQTKAGFAYYGKADMQKAGYDTSVYSNLLAYNPGSSVTAIPKATSVNGLSSIIKVTIPEGYSVPQTFELLVSKGVCASTDYLYTAMESYDFSYYPLVAKIEDNANRCYKLEGYLFPSTYEFYRLSSGQNAIGVFLRGIEAKITDEDEVKAAAMGYSMNQILTVASIIEKEIADPEQLPLVASVIYNRLDIKMMLKMDCGIFYCERYIEPYLDSDVERYNAYYNMYKCAALPAGPICSPGKAAIAAALNPADTDYLFFYSDSDGVYHFSKEYVDPKAVSSVTE
ncbi:MAG: endolytic transglycosylase MltG [Mobilitalea sp.]